MRRIIYCSQATFDFSAEELVELLSISRANNAAQGLSGMLLYASQSFLQMLEGGSEALEATYARIVADDRHEALRMLLDIEVEVPMFPDWTMGFEHVDGDELADDLDGFLPETDHPLVNPDLITNGEVAQRLLELHGRAGVR